MTIWRMRIACWITKAKTHTFIIFNTYCFSTATMVTLTRLNIASYVHYLLFIKERACIVPSCVATCTTCNFFSSHSSTLKMLTPICALSRNLQPASRPLTVKWKRWSSMLQYYVASLVPTAPVASHYRQIWSNAHNTGPARIYWMSLLHSNCSELLSVWLCSWFRLRG